MSIYSHQRERDYDAEHLSGTVTYKDGPRSLTICLVDRAVGKLGAEAAFVASDGVALAWMLELQQGDYITELQGEWIPLNFAAQLLVTQISDEHIMPEDLGKFRVRFLKPPSEELQRLTIEIRSGFVD